MTSQAVVDYLTKQIFIEKNIVTYRSLSRELGIHVNTAKNELATYHAIAPYQSQASAATYLLSGEVLSSGASYNGGQDDVDMDNDSGPGEDGASDEGGEDVPQTQIVLVNERDLESARAQFSRLDSIHVYSLSPSPIRDAGFLCGPTETVRLVDSKGGAEMARTVGKIVGESIQIKKSASTKENTSAAPIAGPSKPPAKSASISKPIEKPAVKEVANKDEIPKEKPKAAAKAPEKPKATGKLNFTKAKPKEVKKEEVAAGLRTKDTLQPPPPSDAKRGKTAQKGGSRRGTKRKSTTGMSDSDSPSSAAQSKPSPRLKGKAHVKNRTVLSDNDDDDDDDDDDDMPQPSRKSRISSRARNAIDSETESNAKALMDVDDDEVIRASRQTNTANEEEEPSEAVADEDVEMSDNVAPKAKTRKRKEKKVVPVGRNGLKKKRVIKSRSTVDAKGWTVTEDYSSYESVDGNEEAESTIPAKGKAKRKPTAPVKEEENESAPSKIKPATKEKGTLSTKAKSGKSGSGTSKGAQRSLVNFFSAPTKAK